tara:strand:+ start:126 stop:407 length:282 start_codon:yes stop_codon:yes gene_type:complete
MSIAQVISWKFNNQSGMSTRDNVITEFPNGIPTQAEQDLWTTEYNTFIDSKQYQRDRAKEYPSMEDQLDDIYHNGIDGWKATIKVTKDKYPKS